MLFLAIGRFKDGIGTVPQDIELLTNDFVGQPLVSIRTAGALKDARDRRVGMMMLVELKDFDAALKFMADSPFQQADLYSDTLVYRYKAEVAL